MPISGCSRWYLSTSFYAELAALPDKQPSSRAGQQAVMELVDKYQREHPEMGIYTKGTR